MNQIDAILQKFRTTTGPDRDLDADIYEMAGYEVKRRPEKIAGAWRGYTRAWSFKKGTRWRAMDSLTGSLDEATSFVLDHTTPKDDIEVRMAYRRFKGGGEIITYGSARIFRGLEEENYVSAPTPALALMKAFVIAWRDTPDAERFIAP